MATGSQDATANQDGSGAMGGAPAVAEFVGAAAGPATFGPTGHPPGMAPGPFAQAQAAAAGSSWLNSKSFSGEGAMGRASARLAMWIMITQPN